MGRGRASVSHGETLHQHLVFLSCTMVGRRLTTWQRDTTNEIMVAREGRWRRGWQRTLVTDQSGSVSQTAGVEAATINPLFVGMPRGREGRGGARLLPLPPTATTTPAPTFHTPCFLPPSPPPTPRPYASQFLPWHLLAMMFYSKLPLFRLHTSTFLPFISQVCGQLIQY